MKIISKLLSKFLVNLLLTLILLSLVFPQALWALTYEEEEKIGRRIHQRIAYSNYLVTDPAINQYVRQIGHRLLKNAGKQPFQYNFYVIRSGTLNAFAVPGGYIYLHSELIISLENEGQLASIMAHEIAHITSRHSSKRMQMGKSVSWAALAAMLAGIIVGAKGGGSAGALGSALVMGGSAASVQTMLNNSREDETEADNKGRRYLTASGYKADDMYGAFQVMLNKTYHTSSNIPTYLSTHPGLNERLASAATKSVGATNITSGSDTNVIDSQYQVLRDRVLALTGEPNRIRIVFQNRLRANPNDAAAKYGLSILFSREQNRSQALKFIKEALDIYPQNAEYLTAYGELYLQRNQLSEAKKSFETALQVSANHPRATLYLARTYELLNEKTKAGQFYDRAVSINSLDQGPEVYELAGRFFGNNGNLFKGHFLTARYFESIGRVEQAIFHYKESLKFTGPAKDVSTINKHLEILGEIEKEIQAAQQSSETKKRRRR